MSVWRHRLADRARWRRERDLERRLNPVEPATAPGRIIREGREYIDLSSNDYLGFASHPEVREAAANAAARWGTGARASRLITGDHGLVEELEAELARLKGTESALVFPSGYQANLGLISAVVEPGDAVFVDRLAHSCLVDGVRLSGARLRVFPHNDIARLEELLIEAGAAPARWVLADAVYSMDGDFAPLPALLDLARRHGATVILDDAHGTGVAGHRGRGTAEHFGIAPRDWADELILVATLSKALGSQGGVVLGPADLRHGLVNASRPFVYSTGISPPAAGAALAAVRLLTREPGRVGMLAQGATRFRQALRNGGLNTMASQTPIVPVLLGQASVALQASGNLRESGILALPIRPPTVPRGTSRLRLTVTADHAPHVLQECAAEVIRVCQSLLSSSREVADTADQG